MCPVQSKILSSGAGLKKEYILYVVCDNRIKARNSSRKEKWHDRRRITNIKDLLWLRTK